MTLIRDILAIQLKAEMLLNLHELTFVNLFATNFARRDFFVKRRSYYNCINILDRVA